MKSVTNVTMNEGTTQVYPVLKYFVKDEKRLVVLFKSPRRGTVVFTENCSNLLGSTSDEWSEENFKIVSSEENVTLKND